MTSSKEAAPALSAGAQALRDTTKWFVGGVAITAAGVFAGSSLTRLGTLDVDKDLGRLLLALTGALVGFVGLGWITYKAIAVLTVESFTLRMLADAGKDDPRLERVAKNTWNKFRHSAPIKAKSLQAYAKAVNGLAENDPTQAKARDFSARVMPDAAFTYVRDRFGELTNILIPATALAVLGFGLFAWAANPPAKPVASADAQVVANK